MSERGGRGGWPAEVSAGRVKLSEDAREGMKDNREIQKTKLNREIVPMSSESSTPGSDKLSLPADKELVLKVIPMPADCNANGDIFGGWVMAQVDMAGSVLPARYVNGRMATVAVNQFIFKQPVKVGDILSFFAEVTRIGNTSITVQVEVYAERFRAQGRYIKVTEASLTYVAIGDDGKPRPIDKPGNKPAQ
jgi:acyl-CoA thioesterase YciA